MFYQIHRRYYIKFLSGSSIFVISPTQILSWPIFCLAISAEY